MYVFHVTIFYQVLNMLCRNSQKYACGNCQLDRLKPLFKPLKWLLTFSVWLQSRKNGQRLLIKFTRTQAYKWNSLIHSITTSLFCFCCCFVSIDQKAFFSMQNQPCLHTIQYHLIANSVCSAYNLLCEFLEQSEQIARLLWKSLKLSQKYKSGWIGIFSELVMLPYVFWWMKYILPLNYLYRTV